MKTYQQKGNESLLILNQKTSLKVFINDVILLKGSINYCTFYMNGGQPQKMVARTIRFFETYLETHGFIRVHQSFMVNTKHIIRYNSGEESLTMANGLTVNISRRKKQILKDFIP